MKKKILGMMLISLGVLSFNAQAFADIASGPQSYTITIPEAAKVVLAGETTIASITTADFNAGSNDQARNKMVVGDGSDTAASYIQTNAPAVTNGRNVTMTVASSSGDTVVFSDNGGILTLTCTDAGGTAAGAVAGLIFRTNAGADTAEPTIGDTAATTKATFAFTNVSTITASGGTANMFDSGNSNTAPLDMVIDLDEGTLGYDDAPGELQFDLTLTVVGVN